MSAYSKEPHKPGQTVPAVQTNTPSVSQASIANPKDSLSESGVIRIDPSLFPSDQASGFRSTGILRELEALCHSMRDMELTIGKEKNKNIKHQHSLRDAQQRIYELTGSVEKLKGEIVGQQAKEESLAEQLRVHAQKLSAAQNDLALSQKQNLDEKRRYSLECESLKILISKEQKRYQGLEREFSVSRRDSESQIDYNINLQQFNSSIQEKKLQSELNKQVARVRALEETVSELKEELSRRQSETEKEQAKLLQTSLELRKTLAQLRNGDAELTRYKAELTRAREKLKSAEAAVLIAKRESLAAAERETTSIIIGNYQDTSNAEASTKRDPDPLKKFLSNKDRQISNISRELEKMRPGQPEKKKVDQILNLMVEQRDQLKEIVTELEDDHKK
ncbi:MAG: hypothetical protein ABI041_09320 [Bdellovibrionia bacterium]